MEEPNSSDHLYSSLTDLMTSLMVIFILLLLVFVTRTAGKDAAITDVLLKKLRQDLSSPRGFIEPTIRQDEHDRNAILVIVPNSLMNFETSRATLKPDGEQFLKTFIPEFAEILCSDQFRASVESIVVEGHTDTQPYSGYSREESRNLNLKLSQDRSMEVVKSALSDLAGMEAQSGCFLEKLSASGRGEQEPQKRDEDSRRVILKIRVKAKELDAIKAEVH